MNVFFLIFAIVVSVLAFGFAVWLYVWVKKQKSSNEKIAYVGELIRKGSNTFIKKEYTILAAFAGVAMVLVFLFLPELVWKSGHDISVNFIMAGIYVAGTVVSAIAGKIGIQVATIANIKTAEAAKEGIKPSFLCGFRGGAVMGMAVVGSSLLGISIIYYITKDTEFVTQYLFSFSFGASSLALFAKAGGGIFTKTADISADLVGKVELGIPEDDPRNPAVIADNVGDNVGDVAGMGADLFDSNVASVAAALVIAIGIAPSVALGDANRNIEMIICFATLGLLASIIGVLFARMGEKGGPTKALNLSTYITTAAFLVLTAIATFTVFRGGDGDSWRLWLASVVGLLVGVIIGITTDYFTNDEKKPVQKTAEASETGPAFTIISGISYGFLSVLPAMIGIAVAALAAFKICEPMGSNYAIFGISMAAVGMLSIVGMIISNDAFGPIVDNARGLAEMGELGDDVVEITDKLDSAGNTVKAVTKGFSIAAAGLTVISLLGAFISEVKRIQIINNGGVEPADMISGFDIMDPLVFFGLLIGATVPAVFSALLMLGVSRNAQRLVGEIHRQFDEIPGLKEGKKGVEPEYDKCIDMATTGALKELIPAGLFTIVSTIIVGMVGGVYAIGGFLTGNIISGLLLALFMSNAGGLWDNSKKYVESGNNGGKGSNAHKAAVVGDTVGDPFKDTAGPSINTQITVVSLVASLLVSLFVAYSIF